MNHTTGLATLATALLLATAGCSTPNSAPADSGTDAGLHKDSGKATDAVRDQGKHDTLKPVDAVTDVRKEDTLKPVDAIADIGKHDGHKHADAVADAHKEDTLKPVDAVADGPDYNCPATVPSGSCSTTTNPHSCWYGSDPRFFCRTQVVCSGSTWVVTTSPLPACTGAEPAGCPSLDASTANECAASNDGGPAGTCVYSTKACACGFTGGPEEGWVCSSVPAGCPELPPDQGDPCTGSASCEYSPCSSEAVCTSGAWNWVPLSC